MPVTGKGNDDLKEIEKILERNKSKPFVKRILQYRRYPKLKINNREATHLMTWMEVGKGRYAVFPTVLYEKGKLIRYSPRKAWEKVRESGNYILFHSPERADWFSKNYKKYWQR
ncbi:hypothetical protein DRP04_00940 [Archaeoglobales archaeon]|nr:MAG: hypothetical protein DRP04_00940 [Archaeoglobales archaeon]